MPLLSKPSNASIGGVGHSPSGGDSNLKQPLKKQGSITSAQSSTASFNLNGPRARIIETVDEHNAGCTTFCTDHTFYFIRLVKGKGESLVEIKNPEYTVELDRTNGSRLGLKIEVQQSVGCLFIKEVVGGLAYTWNSGRTVDKIRPGDRIVQVNEVMGVPRQAQALNEECRQNKKLVLTLRRGSARKIKPGLFVSVKTPFAQLQVNQEGTVEKVDDDGDALIKFKNHGQQWVAKENYEMLTFEDSECFYLRRFEDFKEWFKGMQKKHDGRGLPENFSVGKWPELPRDAHFGFKRTMSTLGVSGWTKRRTDGLQEILDWSLKRVDTLDSEPLIAQFFGNEPVPECGGVAFRDLLKQKLENLVEKHRHAISTKMIVESVEEEEG